MVTVPLVLLAIPSVCAGWLIGSFLFGDYFGSAIHIAPEHTGLAQMAKYVPMGYIGDPNDIAHAMLYLASDESAFVTGTSLTALKLSPGGSISPFWEQQTVTSTAHSSCR